jgi:hypothetical protein
LADLPGIGEAVEVKSVVLGQHLLAQKNDRLKDFKIWSPLYKLAMRGNQLPVSAERWQRFAPRNVLQLLFWEKLQKCL